MAGRNKIYQKIFDGKGNIKEPHPRHIISLVDTKGNSGKSSFFKYLFYNYSEEIGRITYGTTGQLRSSVLNMGKKSIYIVDLTRSQGKTDNQEDLLSIIEDIKNGLVTSNFYGKGSTLIMKPPHIIVSTNYILNYEALSADRWEIYEIKRNKKLGKVNELIKKEKRNNTIKKNIEKLGFIPKLLKKTVKITKKTIKIVTFISIFHFMFRNNNNSINTSISQMKESTRSRIEKVINKLKKKDETIWEIPMPKHLPVYTKEDKITLKIPKMGGKIKLKEESINFILKEVTDGIKQRINLRKKDSDHRDQLAKDLMKECRIIGSDEEFESDQEPYISDQEGPCDEE